VIIAQQHTSVLIVGAGPSGLMMAAQLLRHGVQPIIIDSKQGPTDQSKALAVQARSLEIYRQLGIIDKVVPAGKQAGGMVLNQDGKQIASLSLADVGNKQTPFPYVLLYQQSKNERLLLDYLTANCCPVYWNTTLLQLTQTAQGAEVKLQSGNDTVTLTADWLIGADGAHSAVRKQLNIPFNGDTYANEFFLADVILVNKNLTNNDLQLYWAKMGMSAFFPMPEENGFRVIGSLPKSLEAKTDLELADVLPQLTAVTGISLQVQHVNWFTKYRLHHRMAERFRQSRCFLIGDAAHIHSPVGGQGMNTGLQDAYNLAWKLAGVINQQINDKVLDSYAAERMPVAKELLNTTDKMFKVIMSTNWFLALAKRWLVPPVSKFLWQSKSLRYEFFKRLSQTGITYRDSNLSLHLSQAGIIKAGDRLPYLKVFDEKKQQETDLHEWCAKPGFTLIVFGKIQEFDLFAIAKWITQNYGSSLNFFYLPPSAKNMGVFNALEVTKNKSKVLLVRPDMHIGLINDAVDMDVMDNYLINIVGLNKTSPTLSYA
jgi:2-polyprenyl-6-methoxyphenol hydroxylase-like FAD-dependent oxidoreductase